MTILAETHAVATVEFGHTDTDMHAIYVTTYHGRDDETGTRSTQQVSDADWDAAYGKTDAEKIESLLDWGGYQTEHDGRYCHAIFD